MLPCSLSKKQVICQFQISLTEQSCLLNGRTDPLQLAYLKGAKAALKIIEHKIRLENLRSAYNPEVIKVSARYMREYA